MVFGGVMMWHSIILTRFKWDSLIPLIHIPEGIRAIPIAVAGGLIMAFSIGHLIRAARGVEAEISLTD